MQVRHARRAGTLVEIVDILRDDVDVEMLFEFRNGVVRRIGLLFEQFAPALVVEFDNRRAVVAQRLGRTHVLDTIGGPQSVGIAESGQTAVGTHSGTGKYHNLFHRSISVQSVAKGGL